MNRLYNILKWALELHGWNIAPFTENTFDNGERTVSITISDLRPVQQGFTAMEATVIFTFINGNTWERNSNVLWETLCSFIPLDERGEETAIPDYSNKLTLLDIPEYTDIITEQEEDTGSTSHSVTVNINFNFN